jgi:hypothetical protein
MVVNKNDFFLTRVKYSLLMIKPVLLILVAISSYLMG